MSVFVKCSHKDGQGRECGGELVFSYQLSDESRTCVYMCKECGERTNITQEKGA